MGSGSFNLSIVNHDMYTAYLLVCQRGGSFSGDVNLTYLNLVPEGGLTQHLPIQLAMLPALYTVSCSGDTHPGVESVFADFLVCYVRGVFRGAL